MTGLWPHQSLIASHHLLVLADGLSGRLSLGVLGQFRAASLEIIKAGDLCTRGMIFC